MSRFRSILFIILLGAAMPLAAQSIYIYPSSVTAPRGSYQTATAVVTGVNNKTVTWSNPDGGTIVGTNPCVVNEPCTAALYTTTAGTYRLIATSNANGSVAATSTITYTSSPSAATTWPRLMFTASMLPGIQAKALNTNPMWNNMEALSSVMISGRDAVWSSSWTTWSGSACTGSGQPSSPQTNQDLLDDAQRYAKMSMFANTSSERNTWGCHARDIFIYIAQQFLNGQINPGGNVWSDKAQSIAPLTDWLRAGGYLSSADLAVAHNFQYFMAYYAWNVGYGTGAPSNTTFNSPSIIDAPHLRFMGNNYTMSEILYLTSAALTYNDNSTDDPTPTTIVNIRINASGSGWAVGDKFTISGGTGGIGTVSATDGSGHPTQILGGGGNSYSSATNVAVTAVSPSTGTGLTINTVAGNSCSATRSQVCSDGTAGSLHAYWQVVAGWELYRMWAHLEDPNVSKSAYNAAFSNMSTMPTCSYYGLATSCMGDGRGGESAEGASYAYSLEKLRWVLDMIHTAGYNDPITYGPQMSLDTSSWWDTFYLADTTLVVGADAHDHPGELDFLGIGDLFRYSKYMDYFLTEAQMYMTDALFGRTDRSSRLLWPIMNATGSGFDSSGQNAFGQYANQDLFVATPATTSDPSAPSDPRTSYPTDLYVGGYNQHIFARSGWTTTDNLFAYYCPNALINHEHEYCGAFDIYSNGEYITKGLWEFTQDPAYDDYASAAQNRQLASYVSAQSGGTAATGHDQEAAALLGGQFWAAQQAGLETLLHAELPAYVATTADTTNVYNTSTSSIYHYWDVTAASRSMVYLRSAHIGVIYDRGATGTTAEAKSVSINTTGSPTISTNTASWLTRSSSQKAYWTNLLPAGATLSNAGASTHQSAQDWEPYTRLKVDAGSVASTQFLNVLEWGTSSLTKSSTTLVQSTSGQNFDGAKVGSSLVMFMRSPATFTGVTYPASGATTQYLSDLSPNTSYAITGSGAPGSATSDSAGVLVFASDGTGSVAVAPGGGGGGGGGGSSNPISFSGGPIYVGAGIAFGQ